MEKRKEYESKNVQIVHYSDKYQHAFKALNIEWIQKYFKVEPEDLKSLDHPGSYILDKGGAIFVALSEGEALGVCALVKMDDPDYDYELAKMAVSPKAQGKGMGYLLGKAILAEAEKRGARNVYLESNTKLTPNAPAAIFATFSEFSKSVTRLVNSSILIVSPYNENIITAKT